MSTLHRTNVMGPAFGLTTSWAECLLIGCGWETGEVESLAEAERLATDHQCTPVITDPRYGEVYCDGGRTCECPPAGGEDA